MFIFIVLKININMNVIINLDINININISIDININIDIFMRKKFLDQILYLDIQTYTIRMLIFHASFYFWQFVT